jgi:hypothetical protein
MTWRRDVQREPVLIAFRTTLGREPSNVRTAQNVRVDFPLATFWRCADMQVRKATKFLFGFSGLAGGSRRAESRH